MEVLRKYSISAFHATDFFGRDKQGGRLGPYRSWSEAIAKRFLEELTSAINQRRLYPIGGAVDVTAFNSFSTGERRFLTGGSWSKSGKLKSSGKPSEPYYLAFQTLLTEATRCANTDTLVHFVFDQQHVLEPWAVRLFKQIADGRKHKLWERLGEISYADRRKKIGLQAADLHTHAWYRYLVRRNDMSKERFAAMDALTKRRRAMGIWSKDLMEELLSCVTPEERARLREEA